MIPDPPRCLRRAALAGLLLVALLCGAPLVAVIGSVALNADDVPSTFLEIAGSARVWGLWGKTLGIALATAVAATLVGGPLGLALASAPARESRWLATILSAPLLIPAHVLAVAWVDILGVQGLANSLLAAGNLPQHNFPLYAPAGVVLVQALAWYPVPMWAVMNARRQINSAILDAGRQLGSPRVVWRRVVLPLLWPSLVTGGLVVMLFSLLDFAAPSLLQVQVFTVEIFTSFNSLLDQSRALLLAIPLVITGGATLWIASRIYHARRGDALRERGDRPDSGPTNAWCRGLSLAVTALAVGLPLLALVIRSLPPSNFWATAKTATGELGTSLLISGIGATLALAIALTVSLGRTRWQRVALMASAAGYLATGPVLGVGLIQLWNHPGPMGMIYDHVFILILAVAGRYLVFGLLGCQLALLALPADCIEAARNLGASGRFLVVNMILSPLRRPLFAVWACLALLMMGEVECIVLVAPPGWVPVSLRIFTLMHYGPAAMVSALALIQTLAALGTLAIVARMLGSDVVYTPRKSRYHKDGATCA